MAHVGPQSELDIEIDRNTLGRVGGGEDGKAHLHMAEGIAVGVASYLIDRYERKYLAKEAGVIFQKLGHLVK